MDASALQTALDLEEGLAHLGRRRGRPAASGAATAHVSTSELQDLKRDYRAAFLRYLLRREEAPLHVGYELGRSAVAGGLSILDIAQVHHEVLLEVLRDTSADDLSGVGTAASEFLVEVLSTYDMAHRGILGSGGASGELR